MTNIALDRSPATAIAPPRDKLDAVDRIVGALPRQLVDQWIDTIDQEGLWWADEQQREVQEPTLRAAFWWAVRSAFEALPAPDAGLVQAMWSRLTPDERAALGRGIGIDVLWDEAIVPNLT